MIQINELRITPDAKYLIIDASIKKDSLFENYMISDIVVYNIPDNKSIQGEESYNKTITVENKEGDGKHIRLVLEQKDIINGNLSKGLFKVTIAASKINTLSEINLDNASTQITAVVMNLYPFYKQSIHLLKNIDCNCLENKELVNLILRFKSLELSAKTGNIDMVAYYWFKYFNTSDRVLPMNNCSCHE